MKKILWVICVAIFLTVACDKKEILPGKREAIEGMTGVDHVVTPSRQFNDKIIPSATTILTSYTDISGNKQHNSPNFKVAGNIKLLWKTSLGGGEINSDPIAFGSNVFVVNSNGELICISQKNGEKLWKTKVAQQPEGGVFSGGLTANSNVIYVATNIGEVVALNVATKSITWKKALKYPLRGAPLYAGGKVIVNTIDGKTFALNAQNGNIDWTKKNQSESTIMAESATPALNGASVICAYGTGDLKSLELRTGMENWGELLLSSDVDESGSVIAHIVASPVVLKDKVIAATSSSELMMLDATTGIKLWERSVGTIRPPIANAGWIFLLTNDKAVVCLSEKDGTTRWIIELKDIYIEKKHASRLEFSGPLMINGDIVIFSDDGDVIKLDISTGKLKSIEKVSGMSTSRTPTIVNGQIFAVTKRSELYAIG